MGDIVNFPTKAVRDWMLIERAMDEALSEHGFSPVAKARLTERMKAFYQTLDVDLHFTIEAKFPSTLSPDQIRSICTEISEKIGAINSERLQAFTNKLFFDRLNVEVDLSRALGI